MITTLRSLVYLLFLGASGILFSTPIALFGRILPYRFLARSGQTWGRINLAALKLICGLDYHVDRPDDLPKRNFIVLSKHQSAWETIALRAILPPEHTWVVKRELLSVPFFGWALARYDPIAIDRSSGRRALEQLVTEGKHWLDEGRWVVIFPEGTRVSPGEKKRYGMGGAMLARKSGYPILPVAHNAGVFWRRRDIRKYSGRIEVVFGEPLDPADLSASEINRRVEAWIEETVSKLPNNRHVQG